MFSIQPKESAGAPGLSGPVSNSQASDLLCRQKKPGASSVITFFTWAASIFLINSNYYYMEKKSFQMHIVNHADFTL